MISDGILLMYQNKLSTVIQIMTVIGDGSSTCDNDGDYDHHSYGAVVCDDDAAAIKGVE